MNIEMSDKDRTVLVRRGNELFNNRDIKGALLCYIQASYFGGIERVADYYYFDEKNYVVAYRLYKKILKEESNLGGNIRAKKKTDEISLLFVKAIRKWLKEDGTTTQTKKQYLGVDRGNR